MVGSGREEQPVRKSESVVGQPPRAIVRYTVTFAVTALVLFLAVLWATSAFHPVAGRDAKATGVYWLLLVGLTFMAGALGGSLYSLRCLLMHSSQNDYDTYYNYWYLQVSANATCRWNQRSCRFFPIVGRRANSDRCWATGSDCPQHSGFGSGAIYSTCSVGRFCVSPIHAQDERLGRLVVRLE